MPIYEYQCNACTHRFEALQKMADAPLLDCPNCSQPELKKLVSAAAFKLKGTGWYETDFKNKGNAAPAEGASGDKKSPAVGASGSEAKPAVTAKPTTSGSGSPESA